MKDIGGDAISPEGLAKIAALDLNTLPVLSEDRIGACVAGTGKFICIGLNFSDHAAETGATVPPEPVIFMKATSAIVGPNDNVVIPRGSEKTDWEVELGVVIGKTAKYVSEADALDYVAVIAFPTMSPSVLSRRARRTVDQRQVLRYLRPDRPVARDEGRDHRSAKPWHVAESQRPGPCRTAPARQWFTASRTSVSYLSQFMSLHPGDVISTGTPPASAWA